MIGRAFAAALEALRHPATAQMAVDNPRRVLNPIRVVSNKIRTGLVKSNSQLEHLSE
jgi:hypothetical protein